jgi:hypothetical protein
VLSSGKLGEYDAVFIPGERQGGGQAREPAGRMLAADDCKGNSATWFGVGGLVMSSCGSHGLQAATALPLTAKMLGSRSCWRSSGVRARWCQVSALCAAALCVVGCAVAGQPHADFLRASSCSCLPRPLRPSDRPDPRGQQHPQGPPGKAELAADGGSGSGQQRAGCSSARRLRWMHCPLPRAGGWVQQHRGGCGGQGQGEPPSGARCTVIVLHLALAMHTPACLPRACLSPRG